MRGMIFLMGTKKEPQQIHLTEQQVNELQEKIKTNSLTAEDQDLLVKSLKGIIWLNKMLQAKKLSIRKLSRLFGFKTEKDKKDKKDDDDKGGDSPKTNKNPSQRRKGHGRNSKDDYTGAKRVFYKHTDLSPSDRCPSCDRGNLYEIDSGSFIHITGSAPLEATIHEVQKLRCATCGEIFVAEAPEEVRKQKYDETADVEIALLRYGLGTPFYRLSGLQKYLGVPLAPSTQWERVEHLADGIWPVYEELIKEASKGKVTFVDDTPAKILDLKKQLVAENSKRVGIYTTGLISKTGQQVINLFFTGNRHAGENLDRVLQYRPSSLGTVLQMCDASSNNNTKKSETLKCLCTTHSRRNFVDAKPDRPKECEYAIYLMGKIYHNDNITLERNMSDNDRLAYHQKKSAKWIKKLRRWCLKCFDLKKIEPNEALGEAIQYLLNHWKGLTEFMRTPGAPIDNTITERLIKRSILHRKNSLFFKTALGAYVGDIMMSLIETCKAAEKSPFDYLLALHKNKKMVKENPSNFFPWNFEENLQLSL